MTHPSDFSRRQFLSAALAAGAAACVPSAAFGDDAPAEESIGFTVDASLTPADPTKVVVERESKPSGEGSEFDWMKDVVTYDSGGNPNGLKDEYVRTLPEEPTQDPGWYDGTPADANAGLNPLKWMENLPDDRLISEVNLSGTHDSAMAYGDRKIADGTWARTQCRDIIEQLQVGARILDLRLNEPYDKDERVNHQFRMCHGTTFFETVDHEGYALFFHSAMDFCRSFLKQNPSEFIIIAPKHEKGSESYYREHIEAAITKYVKMKSTNSKNRKKSFVYTGHAIPTVGEVRGCVVLLNRNALWYGMTTGPDWGIRINMDSQDANRILTCDPPVTHKDPCPSGNYIKYVARVDNNCEWNHDREDNSYNTEQFLVNHTDRFPLPGEPKPSSWTDIHMNYTSGFTWKPWPTIKGTSQYTNAYLRNFPFQKGYRYGWMLHDYVGTRTGWDDGEFNPMNVAATNLFKGEASPRKRYISELYLGAADHYWDAINAVTNAGFMVIGNGCSNNAGVENHDRKHIWIGYKTTDDPDEAIRDILATNDHKHSPLVFGGMQYEWIKSSEGCPLDMTKGTGGDKYVYLATTKDPRAGVPITDVSNYISWWGRGGDDREEAGWECARYCNDRKNKGELADMNCGTGSRTWIYVRFRRAAARMDGEGASAVAASESTSVPLYVGGAAAAVAAIGAGVYWYERRRRENEQESAVQAEAAVESEGAGE